jgi:hypothetical protein
MALVLAGCAPAPSTLNPSSETKPITSVPPQPQVKDNLALLVREDQQSARIVEDHVLGNKALPGGSVGDYQAGGDKYQEFIIETNSPQDAAILLLDWKGTLTNADYLPEFGGYFGMDNGKPEFAFAKGRYLLGVAGLSKAAADPVARHLAARVHT